jgi:hypothetical protein
MKIVLSNNKQLMVFIIIFIIAALIGIGVNFNRFESIIEPISTANQTESKDENCCFLLIEEWHSIEGSLLSGNSSEVPIILIDFPTYNINEASKKIRVPYRQERLENLSNTKIIFASGESRGGVIGGGISSHLIPIEDFPVHINRGAYSIDIISNERVLINNNTEIPPGDQYSYDSNSTINYGSAVVSIHSRTTIRNYGIWPKDSIGVW